MIARRSGHAGTAAIGKGSCDPAAASRAAGVARLVEPRRCQLAVADAEANLSRHPPASAVALLVGEVDPVVSRVNVAALGHDPSARRGETVKAAQKPFRLSRIGKEAEVVPVHDDRVEEAEWPVDLVDREQPSIADAAAETGFDRAG